MKKILLFLFAAWVLWGCIHPKPQTARGALTDLLTNFRKHTSISYSVKFRMKYFDLKDTLDVDARCKLIKNPKDTLFNGYVWFFYKQGKYSGIKYYDLDSIYVMDDSLKKITTYYNPKTQYWAITSNTSGMAIEIPFQDTARLVKAIHDTSLVETIMDDKINNVDCWKITIKYPDDGTDQFKISNIVKCFWISKNDTGLKKITSQMTMQQKNQYKEWNIDSIVYDKETPASLKESMKNRFATYKMERYSPPSPESEKPLDNGIKAPSFTGTDFATGKQVSLSDYKGKIVMLDFWYMSCYWCMKAMPTIEKIRDEYTSKGLIVLGLNSFDTSADSKKDLPGFIKANKNTYPTILTSRNTDKQYKIYAYPTLYLINKKGNIAYSDIGYRENLDSVLSAEINKLLK